MTETLEELRVLTVFPSPAQIKTRITAKLVDPETNDMPACGTVNVRIR